MIDRYGKCPNKECNTDWNAGDILVNLRKIEALHHKTEEELVNIAFQCYGYQVSNPKNFSKVIAIQIVEDTIMMDVQDEANILQSRQIVNPDFYMCPNCRKVWDANTDQEYPSLHIAKQSKGFKDEYNSTELHNPFED